MFAFIGVLAVVYFAGVFLPKLKGGPVAPLAWTWPLAVAVWVKDELAGNNDVGPGKE